MLDVSRFIEETGLLEAEFYEENEEVIQPDYGCGCFDVDRLGELLVFCGNNPKYHIITQVDSDTTNNIVYVNRVAIINRNSYWLGTGNKDTNLEAIGD